MFSNGQSLMFLSFLNSKGGSSREKKTKKEEKDVLVPKNSNSVGLACVDSLPAIDSSNNYFYMDEFVFWLECPPLSLNLFNTQWIIFLLNKHTIHTQTRSDFTFHAI